jgi:hypothetical protein
MAFVYFPIVRSVVFGSARRRINHGRPNGGGTAAEFPGRLALSKSRGVFSRRFPAQQEVDGKA